MANAIEKILARKNQSAKKAESSPHPPVASPVDQLTPCSTCASAIRWLNAAGQSRCIGCQPPKFAALVRSREILVVSVGQGRIGDGEPFTAPVRRWEKLIEMPDGRLLSETVIRELVARGELDPITAACVGVGDNGGGVGGGCDGAAAFDRFVECDPDEYFRAVAKTRR